jgi:hypothetical protein
MKIYIHISTLSVDKSIDYFSYMTPGNTGIYKDIKLEKNKDKADWIIGWESLPVGLSDKGKDILVRREPKFINPSPCQLDRVIDFSDDHFKPTSPWWIRLPYDDLLSLKYSKKGNSNTCVSSSKWEHRNSVYRMLSSDDSIKVDYYGRGMDKVVDSKHYRGVLNYNWLCKYKGFQNYEKALVFENSSQKNYFSEKFYDPILSWTLPIYWGCPNISDFFPENSFIPVDISSIESVKEALQTPVEKKHIDAIREARHLIMTEYNLFESIRKYISTL